MKLNALIIDDEQDARENLYHLLLSYCPAIGHIEVCDSVAAASAKLASYKPDLVFLDVEMPGENGFELLKRSFRFPFDVIFVTAFDNYAIQALRYAALDYLMKPLNIDELEAAVNRKLEKRKTEGQVEDPRIPFLNQQLEQGGLPQKIALPSPDGLQFLCISDIIRCEADSNYTRIYMNDRRQLMASRTLKDFEELLEPHRFMRVHHAHLININRIKEYYKGRGGFVVMEDGSTIDVSVRKKEEFLQKLGW